MNLLNATKKSSLIRVEYSVLDTAITVFLEVKGFVTKRGDEYSCVCENEWGNDSCHEFDVEPELPDFTDSWTVKMYEKFRPDTQSVLNWMCADNLIEPGEYLVTVCW